MRARSWSAPGTAPSRFPCPGGRLPPPAAGPAQHAGLDPPAALTARWDRRRRAELAWRLTRELPLAALATHGFAFEQAAEAYACADRKRAA